MTVPTERATPTPAAKLLARADRARAAPRAAEAGTEERNGLVRAVARRILALVRPAGDAATDPRVVAAGPSGLTRWTDYFAVAATARFRATQRARLQDAARPGMILVALVALFQCLWLVPFHPDDLVLVVGLNAGVTLAAGVGYASIRTRARRHPEAIILGVLAVVDLATVALGMTQPALGLVAAGDLLLLPTIVALLVPWNTRTHVAWLVLHVGATIAYAAIATGAALPAGGEEKVTLLAIAVAVSQFGHLTALRARVRSFAHIEHIRALNRLGRRNAQRLDHLNEVLEVTARTDELTGLKNRLSLRRDLRAVRGRITRHGERYGLLVLDLDRFKAVNDTLGHVAGDRALRAVADALLRAIRMEDGAYRYGGEEFVVVMEVAEPNEELLAAERIRRIVEDLDLPNPGNSPSGRITVSVGVARVGPDDLAAGDDAWFGRADAAMYRAKAGGRNRCELEVAAVEAR